MPRLRNDLAVLTARGPAVVAAAVLACCGAATPARAAAPATAFRNPIAPVTSGGLDSPDPWIFTAQGRYWLTGSADGEIVLRSATSLGGLASAEPRRLWPRPGVAVPPSRCCEFWAPELHRLTGPSGPRWYVYSAVDDGDLTRHRIQVLESARDDPRGPYAYRGTLDLGANYAIDATVFTAAGRTYVAYSGAVGDTFAPTSLHLARLRDPWTVTGAPVEISSPELPWETTGLPINEGPEVLVHAGRLSVVYSASWCVLRTYKLGRLTVPLDADLLDPRTWARAKAPSPVFQEDPARGVFGTGHGSFFTSPDGREHWQVYHATAGPGNSCIGKAAQPRTTRAQPFTFGRDGLPRFGRPVSLGQDLRAPSGDPTYARQAEDLELVVGSAATARVADPRLVGGAGLRASARSSGDRLTLALPSPGPGRYRLLVRVRTGPGLGRFRLTAGSTRTREVDTRSTRPGTREVDVGAVLLRRGRVPVSLTVAGPTGSSVELDQLRLSAVRRRG